MVFCCWFTEDCHLVCQILRASPTHRSGSPVECSQFSWQGNCSVSTRVSWKYYAQFFSLCFECEFLIDRWQILPFYVVKSTEEEIIKPCPRLACDLNNPKSNQIIIYNIIATKTHFWQHFILTWKVQQRTTRTTRTTLMTIERASLWSRMKFSWWPIFPFQCTSIFLFNNSTNFSMTWERGLWLLVVHS